MSDHIVDGWAADACRLEEQVARLQAENERLQNEVAGLRARVEWPQGLRAEVEVVRLKTKNELLRSENTMLWEAVDGIADLARIAMLAKRGEYSP